MFTFSQIKNYTYDNDSDHRREYKKRAKEQRKLELEILSNFSSCPIPKSDIFARFPNLQADLLESEIKHNFYKENITSAVACISESLVSVSNEWKDYISQYFTDSKQIGPRSANGVALLTNLTNDKDRSDDIFVLKAPQKDTDAYELYHEAAVGMLALNTLRSKIPNFAYVYGYFKCGEPIVDDNGKVISLCGNNSRDVGYVIYENIFNSKSMNDVIRNNLSPEKYMEYLIQFLYALRTANKEFNYTHYDCHAGNILLRQLSEPSFIKYPINDNDYIHIYTDKIVSFIDYGNNYVEIPDKLGINSNMEEFGMFNDRSFILYDVFKFICFSLHAFKTDSYNENLDKLKTHLLSYFVILDNEVKNYDVFLTLGRREYFKAPYNSITENFSIDDFIQYCLDFISENNWTNPIMKPYIDARILNCDDLNCVSTNDTLKEVGLDINNPIPIPTSIDIFIQVSAILSDDKLQTYVNDFINNYPYSNYNFCIGKALSDFNNYKIKLNTSFIELPNFTYSNDYMKNLSSLDKDDELIKYFENYKKAKLLIKNLNICKEVFNLSDDDLLMINSKNINDTDKLWTEKYDEYSLWVNKLKIQYTRRSEMPTKFNTEVVENILERLTRIQSSF